MNIFGLLIIALGLALMIVGWRGTQDTLGTFLGSLFPAKKG